MNDKGTRGTWGNGTVRQRANGKYEARCVIDGKRRSFYGDTQKEVTKAMRAALKASDDGAYFEPTSATVSQWLDIWLDTYVTNKVKPLTLAAYQSQVKTNIAPALGRIKLAKLNATQIQAFYNELEKTKSPKTIKNIHGILHKALDQAVKVRYIGFNPTDACELPTIEKKEIKPLNERQISDFLQAIEGDSLQDFFTVALFTGMREGEICGLSWDCVDFKRGTITVKQQLSKEKKKGGVHYIATTKNSKARTLTLPTFVLDILKDVRKKQLNKRLEAGGAWNNEFNLVFTNDIGHFIVPQMALKRFKVIAAKIGRPDARFHDLRHTYAVTSLQEGDDVKTVQSNLGHATASFTLDVYGHVSEKMKQDSADRMQKYFDKIKA